MATQKLKLILRDLDKMLHRLEQMGELSLAEDVTKLRQKVLRKINR